jgi:alanine dehydrogenase
MRVGIPTEVKPDENRVALTPSGVTAFRAAGHDVVIQAGAGLVSALRDVTYERAGATVVATATAVWERADLVLKVKEPMEIEFERMRREHVLFTYLHLAASLPLTERLLERRVLAIAYETV